MKFIITSILFCTLASHAIIGLAATKACLTKCQNVYVACIVNNPQLSTNRRLQYCGTVYNKCKGRLLIMNINFWTKHLLDHSPDTGAAVMRLPAAAKIQLGERDVYPWAKKCEDQITEMGNKSLARNWLKASKPPVSVEAILQAVDELRDLVAHNVPAIAFQARRRPRLKQPDHGGDD